MSDSDSDSGSDSVSNQRSCSSDASGKAHDSRSFHINYRTPDPLPGGFVLFNGGDDTLLDERPIMTCASYATPVTLKKKVIRRTNAQIEADTLEKNAVKIAKLEVTASKESAKRKAESTADTFVELKGKRHAVQVPRSNWTVEEQICLIRSYKKWEVLCEKSQDKKLCQITKMWLVEIPALMATDFGRVRLTPSNSMGSSPYKSKWQDIRKKVSDYKAAQPDGREEELPDSEAPTGGGLDENGIEDERTERAGELEQISAVKRNERYLENIDKESLIVIEYFMKTYPQSITGVGIMSENDLITGAGRKRESCQILGMHDSTVLGGVDDVSTVKKISKSSLIMDLTKTAVAHHEESMEFQRMNFEYQKESRKEDIERLNARDVREVNYRDQLDIREQGRYNAEQERLALEQTRLITAQEDTKNINAILGGFLTSMLAKL